MMQCLNVFGTLLQQAEVTMRRQRKRLVSSPQPGMSSS